MTSDLNEKIVTQLEYYFGNYNLSKDKFLKQKVGENEDGFVDFEVLLTFKRLNSLCTDISTIKTAVETSNTKLLSLSEDGKKIRRNPDLPIPEMTEEKKKEIVGRTAYAKGFPLDASLDDIIKFFDEYGPIESCYKRNYLDKATKEHKFKGSCFIIFTSLDLCKKFVEMESVKYNEAELLRKFQQNYFDEKKQEYAAKKNERKNKKGNAAEALPEITFPKGTILHFTGISDDQLLTREEIKEKITEVGEVEPSYIDYNKNDKEGYLRMGDENGAKVIFDKLTDGELEVNEVKLKFRVLEGEEEDKYFDKMREIMLKRKQNSKNNRKGMKRKGGHFDRNNKRQRH